MLVAARGTRATTLQKDDSIAALGCCGEDGAAETEWRLGGGGDQSSGMRQVSHSQQ